MRPFFSSQTGLVLQARLSGPIPWVIAIMVGLTVIAAAAALALHHAAQAARADLAGGITVQIVEALPEARQRQAEIALALLRRTPSVAEAHIVPQAEITALLAPWLGTDAEGDGDSAIPVPALIDARLAGAITPARLQVLGQTLRRQAPSARLDAQSTFLSPVLAAMQALEWLALAGIALLALVTIAAVLLATRTALGSHRDTIGIVHVLGGSDGQIALLFQRSIAIDAGLGAAAGLATAMAVVWALGQRLAAMQAGITAGAALGWGDWLLLALVPVAGVALAVLTARITVMRTLARML